MQGGTKFFPVMQFECFPPLNDPIQDTLQEFIGLVRIIEDHAELVDRVIIIEVEPFQLVL